jgi:hypothetical protein
VEPFEPLRDFLDEIKALRAENAELKLSLAEADRQRRAAETARDIAVKTASRDWTWRRTLGDPSRVARRRDR